MATPAAIQAELDAQAPVAGLQITRSVHASATVDNHYVTSTHPSYQGRSRWCDTTSSETAAQQATAIIADLASD